MPRLRTFILLTFTLILSATWMHSHHALDRLCLPTPNTGSLVVTSAMGTLSIEYRNDRSLDDGTFLSSIPWRDFTDPLRDRAPQVRDHFTNLAAANWLLPQFTTCRYAAHFSFTAQLCDWHLLFPLLALALLHPIRKILRRRNNHRPFPIEPTAPPLTAACTK